MPRPRPILAAICALALLASAAAGETIKWITAGTDLHPAGIPLKPLPPAVVQAITDYWASTQPATPAVPPPVTQPVVTPPTQPTPVPLNVVRIGQPLPATVAPGKTLLIEAKGTWDIAGPITIAGDGVTIAKWGEGEDPIIYTHGQGGILATGTFSNLTVRGIAFVNKTPAKLNTPQMVGIDLRKRFTNATLDGVTVQGYEWNLAAHHPKLDQAPRAEWCTNLRLLNCRLLDAKSPQTNGGQGAYLANLDGIAIDGGIVDCSGWDGNPATPTSIFRHDLYIAVWTAHVTVHNVILSRGASYGLQARNGADVQGCLFVDNAMGCMVNGPAGVFSGNVVITGHVHTARSNGMLVSAAGQGGLDWHCGGGPVQNNLFIGAVPRPAGYYVPPAINSTPRGGSQGWEFKGPCLADTIGDVVLNWRGDAVTAGRITGAVVKRTQNVDLSALPAFIQRARAGKASAAEGIALVKRAAGAN